MPRPCIVASPGPACPPDHFYVSVTHISYFFYQVCRHAATMHSHFSCTCLPAGSLLTFLSRIFPIFLIKDAGMPRPCLLSFPGPTCLPDHFSLTHLFSCNKATLREGVSVCPSFQVSLWVPARCLLLFRCLLGSLLGACWSSSPIIGASWVPAGFQASLRESAGCLLEFISNYRLPAECLLVFRYL